MVPVTQNRFTETMTSPSIKESLEPSVPERDPVHHLQDSSTASSSESDPQPKIKQEQSINNIDCVFIFEYKIIKISRNLFRG